MMLIFSETPALASTYGEILAEFNPKTTTQRETFLKSLINAKMAIIDQNKDLLKETIALDLPITILFISDENDIEEDVAFLRKPLSSSVLFAKVDLLWKRIQKGLFISFRTNHYNFDGNTNTLNGTALTQKEAELIEYLWENKDRIVPKEELLKQIFGYKEGVETHTLETHIYKLRQKMNAAEDLILTRDGGYQLNLED
ncbi:MAG: response regulator transcription factor [Alphaproteobacteria bacterium]|nr:response regulator transcription factor [Alphaproteobacteria bacterium]